MMHDDTDTRMAEELDDKAGELWEQEARKVLGDAEFEQLYPAIRKEQRQMSTATVNRASTIFDVIYTFENAPQLHGEVTFAGRPSEAQVLKGILNGLSIKETATLRKISICQLHCATDGVLAWVEDNPRECKILLWL